MGRSVSNGFVYDDVPFIANNPLVTNPTHWRDIPGSAYWLGTHWRPVTVAGFALQWYLSHGAPWVFHACSLGLYLVLAWCVLRLLREVGAPLISAGVAVLAFVVHPVHVEVVANVVGQAELLAATALVAATWMLPANATPRHYPPSPSCLARRNRRGNDGQGTGICRPTGVDGCGMAADCPARRAWRNRIRLLLPATAFTILMLVVRSTVTGTLKGAYAAVALAHLGFRDRLVTFIATVPEYARLLVWPSHLQAEYAPPHLLIAGPITGRHVMGIVLIMVVVALFVWSRRRAPLVAFGLWWAAVAIGPVSSVLTATGIVMAERVFFLPSLGFALASRARSHCSTRPLAAPSRSAVHRFWEHGSSAPPCEVPCGCRCGTIRTISSRP